MWVVAWIEWTKSLSQMHQIANAPNRPCSTRTMRDSLAGSTLRSQACAWPLLHVPLAARRSLPSRAHAHAHSCRRRVPTARACVGLRPHARPPYCSLAPQAAPHCYVTRRQKRHAPTTTTPPRPPPQLGNRCAIDDSPAQVIGGWLSAAAPRGGARAVGGGKRDSAVALPHEHQQQQQQQ